PCSRFWLVIAGVLPSSGVFATMIPHDSGDRRMDHHALRRRKLACSLSEEGLDSLLVTSAVNVTYLTGFTGDSSFVVLTRDRALLLSDPRYIGQIADECSGL